MTLSQMQRRLSVFWRGNPLVRLLAVNAAIGFGLSALFVGALASLDLGHMGRLLGGGETWPFAIVLWFFTGLTFASVQMGIAVMALARGGGGGARRRVASATQTTANPAVDAAHFRADGESAPLQLTQHTKIRSTLQHS